MHQLYMLDTDICSYVIRGTSDLLVRRIKGHKNQLCISSITLAELLFGAARKNSPRLTDAVALFQQLVEVRNWTQEAAAKYAKIRMELENSGSVIGNMDMLIAAAAQAENAWLVTNNIAHFSRVKGLKFENWLND